MVDMCPITFHACAQRIYIEITSHHIHIKPIGIRPVKSIWLQPHMGL